MIMETMLRFLGNLDDLKLDIVEPRDKRKQCHRVTSVLRGGLGKASRKEYDESEKFGNEQKAQTNNMSTRVKGDRMPAGLSIQDGMSQCVASATTTKYQKRCETCQCSGSGMRFLWDEFEILPNWTETD
jgi:hypothetical protein